MKKYLLISLIFSIIISCSHKKQIVYLHDNENGKINKIGYFVDNKIEIGDILKIDINTSIPEASAPYKNLNKDVPNNSIDLLLVEGYVVKNDSMITYPILGEINVVGFTEKMLSSRIYELLVEGGHLTNPFVSVKRINSKFTILGEVGMPGTYNNFENQLNIFQAIGIAGDLLITAKRNNVTLIREENGLRKTYKFSLNNSDLFDKPYYYIKSNDVIIIEPNFSKIKSAGFIGSPSSIASISSLLLSITLLLINN